MSAHNLDAFRDAALITPKDLARLSKVLGRAGLCTPRTLLDSWLAGRNRWIATANMFDLLQLKTEPDND
jgi:hypothetical protein